MNTFFRTYLPVIQKLIIFSIVLGVVGLVLFEYHVFFGSGVAVEGNVRGYQVASVDEFLQKQDSMQNATTTDSLTGSATSVFYKQKELPDPVPAVASALVVDGVTGAVLFEKQSARLWPTASIAKLMNAVIAVKYLSPSDGITIPDGGVVVNGEVSTGTPLGAGTRFSVADILSLMLTVSSNEAAETLASTFGRERFLNEMNKQAIAWGMYNTNFDDPTGLSVANQSTATDIAILARHLLVEYPQILAITTHPKNIITNLETGQKLSILNINQFAGQSSFLGGKTGYTDEANGNLVSVFSHSGHPVIVVVLGTNDRFAETRAIFSWFTQSFSVRNS